MSPLRQASLSTDFVSVASTKCWTDVLITERWPLVLQQSPPLYYSGRDLDWRWPRLALSIIIWCHIYGRSILRDRTSWSTCVFNHIFHGASIQLLAYRLTDNALNGFVLRHQLPRSDGWAVNILLLQSLSNLLLERVAFNTIGFQYTAWHVGVVEPLMNSYGHNADVFPFMLNGTLYLYII